MMNETFRMDRCSAVAPAAGGAARAEGQQPGEGQGSKANPDAGRIREALKQLQEGQEAAAPRQPDEGAEGLGIQPGRDLAKWATRWAKPARRWAIAGERAVGSSAR
jgi:hypothetical protein